MERICFQENWLFGERGKEKKSVCLPHDAMLEQGRCPDADSGSGGAYFQGGIYEYTKKFWVAEEWRSKEVFLEFEGIYPNAIFILNGVEVGRSLYGYTGSRILLENLKYSAKNELLVIVDNSKLPNSRWYSGAGIYRPVWLWIGNERHIQPNGIRVTTISLHPAQIMIETTYKGKKLEEDQLQIEICFDNKIVAKGYGEKAVITIPDAKFWSHEEPSLYSCIVSLGVEGKKVDKQKVSFGIRNIKWSTDGFFINGKRVLLKGGCIHHDNGILGARGYGKSEWRRIKRLKENGFNAIRSSHNPISTATLEACDYYGMYVMDETWDMWYEAKNPYDYSNEFESNYINDVESMVEKDYNHPSVIMYSIGNEVSEPKEEKGVALGKKLVDLFHRLDMTRPVTAGINLTLLFIASMSTGKDDGGMSEQSQGIQESDKMDSTAYNEMISTMGSQMNKAAASDEADRVTSPILDVLDIAGYNYASSRYSIEGEKHSNRIVVGSETFPHDLVSNWKAIEEHSYIIGDFMWTAWDYLGEVGIGAWTYETDGRGFKKNYPWILADTGAFDILGNDNAEAGLASVVWKKRKTPYIGVVPVNHSVNQLSKAIWRGTNALPYWSYRGCDGNPAEVEVYSNAYEIELFLNDRSLGKKKPIDMKTVFQTSYESGTLRAVAYDNMGQFESESILRSAEGEIGIRILAEDDLPEKGEILYLDIAIVGKNDEIECNRDTCLSVQVQGGVLLAFGSANPRTEENYLDGKFTTYYGRSQAVVKCGGDYLKIKVVADDIPEAILECKR